MTSYHDLHITTATIPRTSIFDLPYGLEVTCNRVGGWGLWNANRRQVAGEFAKEWLILDVGGHVIVNSRDRAADA